MARLLFKWHLFLVALLIVDGCAKRETKTIGTGGRVPQKEGENQVPGSSDESKSGQDDQYSDSGNDNNDTGGGIDEGSSEGSRTPETLPEGLSKSEYDQGQMFVGQWNGLSDEPDPTGKWSLRAMPNPTSLEGGGVGPGIGGAGNAVSLAEVRPIIQAACASCHSPNGSRSTSPLVTDEQLIQQASSIKSRVRNGSMPPGGGLPPEQMDLIARWDTNALFGAGSNPAQQFPQQQAPGFGVNGSSNSGWGGLQ